jgi:hypothetical protein
MDGSMGKKKRETTKITRFKQDIYRFKKNYISSVVD